MTKFQLFSTSFGLQKKTIYLDKAYILNRGVCRTFELHVLTVIDCPKIAGAKGQ